MSAKGAGGVAGWVGEVALRGSGEDVGVSLSRAHSVLICGPLETLDPDTIHRKGDLVKMWDLYDYQTAQTGMGASYLSYKSQHEYDCAEERLRLLAMSSFSGNMGNGKPVSNVSDEHKWQAVQPESVGKRLWKVACGKE